MLSSATSGHDSPDDLVRQHPEMGLRLRAGRQSISSNKTCSFKTRSFSALFLQGALLTAELCLHPYSLFPIMR